MGIKRGVSLYSYQQTQFFKQMDWKDMVREIHDNLHTDGVEIIDEATIRDYPFPSEQFIFDWNNYIARYEMKPVTMDIYLDVHQFRDHIMNHREAAERLKNDIKLAARLGFQNVRPLCLVPIDVIEMALDTAEKYNVRIECTEQSLSESAYLFSEERFHSFFQFAASGRKRGYQLFLPTVWYHCTGFLLLDDRRKSKILSGFIR